MPKVRVATRGSALAVWQAEEVARRLRHTRPGIEAELVVVDTTGDRRLDLPVWELGGQGVFVKEVQSAVLDGRADLAVHSAKDLPSTTAPGLSLACVPVRADPRDVLVGSTLAGLRPGAVVATGSVRRRAQLAWIRPDLTFSSLRGNIATRLDRVPSGGALVVAAAALVRLGISVPVAEVLDVSVMLPQVGQGAIAVECREGDESVRGLLAFMEDADARIAVDAERAFLRRLGGGCDLPVGAYAEVVADTVEIEGLLASLDGRVLLRKSLHAPAVDAEALGTTLAEELLQGGGQDVLDPGGISS